MYLGCWASADQQETYQESYIGKATTFPRQVYEKVKVFGLPRKLDQEVSSVGKVEMAEQELIGSSRAEVVQLV
jgi:hypothetical protein